MGPMRMAARVESGSGARSGEKAAAAGAKTNAIVAIKKAISIIGDRGIRPLFFPWKGL